MTIWRDETRFTPSLMWFLYESADQMQSGIRIWVCSFFNLIIIITNKVFFHSSVIEF